MQKTCENHCRRRAAPPPPWDTGHLKQGDGKREIGRFPRRRRRIIRWLLVLGGTAGYCFLVNYRQCPLKEVSLVFRIAVLEVDLRTDAIF